MKIKAPPFANCIRKNYKHIRKWAKRTYTNCFRIYDREIPQFPLAIDFYAGRFCIHYFSRTRTSENPSPEIIQETEKALHKIFDSSPEAITWKMRSKHKETRQYEKLSSSGAFFTVIEYGIPFKVNLVDYLDTGLFLDHRETRACLLLLPGKKSIESICLHLLIQCPCRYGRRSFY